MKVLYRPLLLLPLVFALPFTLSATAEEISSSDYQLDEFVTYDIAVLPEPVTHPVPPVKSRFIGTELDIKLIITKEGEPIAVRLARPLASYSDVHLMSFAAQMEDFISGWKFTPAEDAQGNPVQVAAILPIRVVEKSKAPAIVAGIKLTNGQDNRS